MDTLETLRSRLKDSQKFYLSKKGELDNIEKELALNSDNVKKIEKETETLMIEKQLIDNACTEAREQGRQFLEELATLAASSVFKDDTKVKLVLDEKGNTPVLDVLVTERDEFNQEQVIDPNLDGGGLNDVISMCFLISIGSTVEDNFTPYILDEPSKYVSKGAFASNFADYMKDVSEFTNKQIIMSTHDAEMLDIGKTRYTIHKNPITKVSEVKKDF